jgi:hypothetical protein
VARKTIKKRINQIPGADRVYSSVMRRLFPAIMVGQLSHEVYYKTPGDCPGVYIAIRP